MDSSGVAMVVKGLTQYGYGSRSFADVSFQASPGDLVLVCGGQPAGRSALLLTLSGRLGPFTGHAAIGGHPLPDQAREVRRLSAVARIRPSIEPGRWDAVAELAGPDPMAGVLAPYLLGLDRSAVFGELSPVHQVLLLASLALAGRPRMLVVDDLDAGCGDGEAELVWQALADVAASGVTVLASSDWPDPAAMVQVRLRNPAHVDRGAP